MILAAGMTVTLTLSDLLMLTIIGCLIVLTVYLVLTLKAVIRLLNESRVLINESTKIVDDVQEKTKVMGDYMTDALTNGHGIFKIFSVMNRQR